MTVIGIDEMTAAWPRMQELRSGPAVREGLTIFDNVKFTVFGAAVLCSFHVTPGPFSIKREASFTEPAIAVDDPTWEASISRLRTLANDMSAGTRSGYAGNLMALANHTVASVKAREDNVTGWASALAADVADLDD